MEENACHERTSDRDAAVSRSTKDLMTRFLSARPAHPQAIVAAAEDDDDNCVLGNCLCRRGDAKEDVCCF